MTKSKNYSAKFQKDTFRHFFCLPAQAVVLLIFLVMQSTTLSECSAQDTLRVGPEGLDLCSSGDYKLVWQDEFDGEHLDRSKWFSYFPFTANGSDSCASCRALVGSEFLDDDNLILQDGILHIRARRDTVEWFGKTYNYSSGSIFSMKGFRYGRFEIRCKLPKGKGFWPSFWTAGDGVIEEIDVFETKGHIMRQLQSNYHNCYDNRDCQQPKWHWTPDQTQWNVYAIEWDPYFIHWYVNGKKVRTLAAYKNSRNNRVIRKCRIEEGVYLPVAAYPRHHHRIISGLAVGGAFAGKVSSGTKFPNTMDIDYIRIYQRENSE